LRNRQSGQATVELALCLPFVAAIVAGVVELGFLVGDYVTLWHGAREAARAAVVDPEPAAARKAIERVGLEGVEVLVRPDPAYRVQGRPLSVSLSYTSSGHVPLVGELASALEFRAHASMRIEQP
jgi:hypothetical protein